jgi:hypothetical protein
MLAGRDLARWIPRAALLILGAAACSPEERDFGSGDAPPDGCGEPEACFDGADNDCDGQVDCADADCDAGAVCVPEAAGAALGVLVAEGEPCPEGFTAEEQPLHRGLSDKGCEGCSCTPNPTDCVADAWFYEDTPMCTADGSQSGGVYAGKVGFECTPQPLNEGNFMFGGVRVSVFEVIQSCSAAGTPKPVPATWQQSRKFCRASDVGAGCAAGSACVARQEPAAQCAMLPGSATCDGYAAPQSDWYTGYTDARSCASCGCTVSGGSCDDVLFELGNDYSCFPAQVLTQGTQWCGQGYAPPARLVGTPAPSTCTANASATGSLDPTGQTTLCCLQ